MTSMLGGSTRALLSKLSLIHDIIPWCESVTTSTWISESVIILTCLFWNFGHTISESVTTNQWINVNQWPQNESVNQWPHQHDLCESVNQYCGLLHHLQLWQQRPAISLPIHPGAGDSGLSIGYGGWEDHHPPGSIHGIGKDPAPTVSYRVLFLPQRFWECLELRHSFPPKMCFLSY